MVLHLFRGRAGFCRKRALEGGAGFTDRGQKTGNWVTMKVVWLKPFVHSNIKLAKNFLNSDIFQERHYKFSHLLLCVNVTKYADYAYNINVYYVAIIMRSPVLHVLMVLIRSKLIPLISSKSVVFTLLSLA